MKKKLSMQVQESASIEERFQQFLSASAARGLSDKTLKTYREHLRCISKHLDITAPLSSLAKSDTESMITSMRASGLATNSISSYVRAFKSFLTWCNEEGYASIALQSFKPKDTVKETYSDEEIEKLIEARQNARKEKNWAEADRIRDELKAQGIVLEDTPQGVKWHRE